ncbi:MAG: glycosyltransferase family 4 protein [Desulfobacterales bacterium]|nr:glycosyltransferase family 4 protein [Desulfobacterales bacterium]
MRRPRERFTHQSVGKIRATVDYLPHSLFLYFPKLLYHNLLLAFKRPDRFKRALNTAIRRLLRNRKIATIKHLFQAVYLVHRLLPDSGVTHLHAHFAHSPTSVAMFAGLLADLPFSFTAHAKDIYTSDSEQLREKVALAKFVVTCTEYNKRFLLETAHGGDTPVHRIYHGIDLELFSNDAEPRKKTGPPHNIVTVARITPKKGLATVYKALQLLCDQGASLRHTLIGDGEDRKEILKLITELGLNGVAKCLGTQPHEVVLAHYRRADLFVLGCEIAKNGDRDGIPNVLLECMAMGVPVVATRVSAIPELIEDGKTGLLVPPGQPDKMARAIDRLLTDDDLRNRIIPAARKRVVEQFNNRVLIEDLAGRFREVGL